MDGAINLIFLAIGAAIGYAAAVFLPRPLNIPRRPRVIARSDEQLADLEATPIRTRGKRPRVIHQTEEREADLEATRRESEIKGKSSKLKWGEKDDD